MNSSILVFVALAAFAVDAAVVPLGGVWGNGISGVPLNSLFGNGGSSFALGPVSTLKIVPATSLVSAAPTTTTQVVSSAAPTSFPSVIHPAPGVRCVCTSTEVNEPVRYVRPSMNLGTFGPFSFNY